jgi:hypothetical protein
VGEAVAPREALALAEELEPLLQRSDRHEPPEDRGVGLESPQEDTEQMAYGPLDRDRAYTLSSYRS